MERQSSLPQPLEIDFQPLSPPDAFRPSLEPLESQQLTQELSNIEPQQSNLLQHFSPEPENHINHPDTVQPESAERMVHNAVVEAISSLGFSCDLKNIDKTGFSKCCTSLQITVPTGSSHPIVRSSPTKSWAMNYSVLSFLMNGQLYAEYERISNMLGLPHCSHYHWRNIVKWTEEHVTSTTVKTTTLLSGASTTRWCYMHNYYVIFLIKSTHNTCRKLMASHTLQSTSSPVQPKVRGFCSFSRVWQNVHRTISP